MKRIARLLLVVGISLGLSSPILAQARERMKFQSGNDNAFAEASIRGKQYRDYLLAARKGQKMYVSLSPKGNAYFNILPPGSSGEAIYNAAMSGNDGNVTLPATGDYVVRVYLMGNDADTNRRVSYTLSVGIN